jgi:hypothetical protein
MLMEISPMKNEPTTNISNINMKSKITREAYHALAILSSKRVLTKEIFPQWKSHN